MFGSCIDILVTIREDCAAAESGDDTNVFCKRTEIGAVIGILGCAAGFFAAVFRFFYPAPSVKGLIGESIMSSILTILFALCLAMVTGIGGPGQAVGDLYYGSWLSFFSALGIASSLYAEATKQKALETALICGDSVCEGPIATPYSFIDSDPTCSR